MSDRKPGQQRLVIEPRRKRKRTMTPTVERIAPPKPPTWRETGELRLDELEDSGVWQLEGPSAEHEIAPVVAQQAQQRARSTFEQGLRTVTYAALVLLLLVFFGRALYASVRRAATGVIDDPWRAVPLSVVSEPTGAKIFVEGQLRGTTPYKVGERCLGRTVKLRLELSGHAIWQWSGLCTARGVAVDARLQRISP